MVPITSPGTGKNIQSESVSSRTKRSPIAANDGTGKQAGVRAGPGSRHQEQTLYTWRRHLESQRVAVPGGGKNAEEWASEDKFAVVLEPATLNAAELAEYCRRKGLYAEQIAPWRLVCSTANANAAQVAKGQRAQSKGDQKRIRSLEKELNRK